MRLWASGNTAQPYVSSVGSTLPLTYRCQHVSISIISLGRLKKGPSSHLELLVLEAPRRLWK